MYVCECADTIPPTTTMLCSAQCRSISAFGQTPLPTRPARHHPIVQVQAVLQSAIDKLALMSVIVVDPSTQAQELTKSVGEDISRMITQQKQLEQRFQELMTAQPALRTMANKASLQANQAELQQVSSALRQATKQLCRNLRDNPK